ncbi:MAG: hypothetical protein ACRD1Z_21025, partial [Vicinamibacteria bacterium]
LESVVREFGPTPERRTALRAAFLDLVAEAFGSKGHGEAPFERAEAVDDVEGFNEAVTRLRAALLDAMRLHERGGTEPCWTERTNVIAWLAHALRLQPFMRLVERRVGEFEHEHETRHQGN